MNNAKEMLKEALLETDPLGFLRYKLSYLYVNASKERRVIEDLLEIDVRYLVEIGFSTYDSMHVNRYIKKLNSKILNKSFFVNDDGFWICRNWGNGGETLISLNNAISGFEFYKEYNKYDAYFVDQFINVCAFFYFIK